MSPWERVLPGLAAYRELHPLVVHFPIALFPLALLVALFSLGDGRRGVSAGRIARVLLVAGVLSALAAVASGLFAARSLPHGRGSLVATHRAFMLVTAGIATFLAIVFRDPARLDRRSRRRLLAAGLAVTNLLLVLGADRGALLALRVRGAVTLPRGTSFSERPVAASLATASVDRGRLLYERLRCTTCHDESRHEEAPGIPPSLLYAGSRLRAEWVHRYLLDPQPRRWADDDRRPLIRMPDYHLTDAEALDITAYLASRRDTIRFPESPRSVAATVGDKDAERGRDIFAQYACLGCHELGGQGSHVGPSLDAAGERLEPAYVRALLTDPQAVVPGTPMKNFGLWKEETQYLAAYLMSLHAADAKAEPPPP